ncbi:unnamed protein product [Anisakis simplex]|uniref:Exosome complex component RRP43 (inferred by orthology to a human protein) n=1 Tax=Anisakis simplex TaxID=6269 RepID=A0A0M3JDN0_ANISI|nr:unnamed protein product [Anisakis simplex]VDK25657.1 unnamed protein product [Anisakis simplex]
MANSNLKILNVSGSFLDALVTCATGALLDVRLPRVELDLDEDMVPNTSDIQVTEQYESIQLADLPVLSTFIVLDVPSKNEMKILCDPPAELFELLPNQMNILVGNGGKIYRTVINGYCGDESIIQKLFALASSRQKVVAEALLAAKEAHLKKTLKN